MRHRLAVVARERGKTMGAPLAEVAERLERESFFAKARQQLTQLREDDPEGWAADREDSRDWQEGTDRDTLSAQDEPRWWG